MAESETLHDLFVDELKDAYDAEKQLLKALRKMSKAATHPDLAAAFASHLEETNGQIAILEEVFEMIELKPRGKHCPGIAGIIEEGNDAIEAHEKSPLLDAALVGGGKRAEHYEIAAYTTLIAMATELGLDDVAARLDEILEQEIACDEKLDGLASELLPLAHAIGEEDNDAEDEDDDAPASRRAPNKKASAKKASPRTKSARKTTSRR